MAKAIHEDYKRKKLKVLREADDCKRVGEIGTLLQMERLYTFHLCIWWKLRPSGLVTGLSSAKRSSELKEKNQLVTQAVVVEKEIWRLKANAEDDDAPVVLK